VATIKREVELGVDAQRAWNEVGDFGNAANVFAPVLTDCQRSGDERSVTFANGRIIRERLVTLDEAERRLVYTVLNGGFTQHSAAFQIVPTLRGCRFIWISDFLPDSEQESMLPLVEAGCAALARYFAS
jgi:hypothetical protein